MNFKAVVFGVAKLLQVLGLFLFIPFFIAIFENKGLGPAGLLKAPEVLSFAASIISSEILGYILAVIFKEYRSKQTVKEGFAIVTFGWVTLTFFGSIPLFIYFMTQSSDTGWFAFITHFSNAFFEIMSGFTTTGATILTDIEALPNSLLFWRSLTHWLGGMGIVTLALAIFPAMGVSGYQMFKGEVPGPSADRLQPRLAETARILWTVYVFFTFSETLLLWVGGMSFFDAITHSFATMATGGFSTKNASIAAFDSDFIHWVIIIFMFLAGANFLVHYRVLRGKFDDFKTNSELKFYAGIIVSVVVFMTIFLSIQGVQDSDSAIHSYRVVNKMDEVQLNEHLQSENDRIDSFYNTFKHSAFQVVAIVTTTGFATADFDVWPHALRLLLVMLMFFGGSAGSTGGGMKMIRIMTIFKYAYRELRKILQPRLVQAIKIGHQPVDEKQVQNIIGFGILFVMIFVAFSFIMTWFIPDLTTAATSVISALGNIGPGLGGVGVTENYSWISLPGKWVLILAMLMGRLEIFTVLVIFRFSAWRK